MNSTTKVLNEKDRVIQNESHRQEKSFYEKQHRRHSQKRCTRGTSAEKLSPSAQLQGYLASGRATCAEIYSSCENESLLVGEKARARSHVTKNPSFRHITFGFRVMRKNEPRNHRERFASVSIAKARRDCNIFFQSKSERGFQSFRLQVTYTYVMMMALPYLVPGQLTSVFSVFQDPVPSGVIEREG